MYIFKIKNDILSMFDLLSVSLGSIGSGRSAHTLPPPTPLSLVKEDFRLVIVAGIVFVVIVVVMIVSVVGLVVVQSSF